MKLSRAIAGLAVAALTLSGCSLREASNAASAAQDGFAKATAAAGEALDTPCLDPSQPLKARVCTAYVTNASLLARWPYYELGRGAITSGTATSLLEKRYTGQALEAIKAQVQSWPDNVSVSKPQVKTDSITIAADEQTATLTTTETWLVQAGDPPADVFRETVAPHTVTMVRDPSGLVDSWLVSQIS